MTESFNGEQIELNVFCNTNILGNLQVNSVNQIVNQNKTVNISCSDNLINSDCLKSDQQKLLKKTKQAMEQVFNKIGGQVYLQRTSQLEELEKSSVKNHLTVIVGDSGVGKSSLARDYAEKLILEDLPVLWFNGRSFEKIDFPSFETELQLTHSLETVIESLSNQPATLFLDGLDRLYTSESFQLVSTFLNLFKLNEEQTPWRLLVTCQTQELSRLSDNLIKIGIAKNHWKKFICSPLSINELEPIWQAFPATSRLKYQTHLRDIFGNLKILDLVTIKLSTGENIQVNQWVNESSVAIWFWDENIKQSIAKGNLVKKIADSQAEKLIQSVSSENFNEESEIIESLIKSQICVQTKDDSIIFQHDLYGDWFRFRLIISHENNLINYLRERLKSPMWHRAVRLYGLYLLEHRQDINQWSKILQTLADDNNLLAQDLLLEAPVFASNPLPILESIYHHLIENEGELLKRLLNRFLNSATLPDPYFLEIARSKGYKETEFKATFRYPYCPFWLPMLRFLYKYRQEFIHIAPFEICKIVKLWLEYTSQEPVLRLEMAQIGLMLAENVLLEKNNYNSPFYQHRKDIYRVVLMGARELPEKVSNFALRASERITRRNKINKHEDLKNNSLSQIDSLEFHSASIKFLVSLHIDYLASIILLHLFTRSHSFLVSNQPIPEPWTDGPKRSIDEKFCDVVLETQTILPLIQANPSVAREVILAVLIKARSVHEWDENIISSRELDLKDIHKWNPPLYTLGPFLIFLQTNFDEGLELIARLIDFATERWLYRTEIDAKKYKYREQNANITDQFVAQLVKDSSRFPEPLILIIDNVEHEFIGDSRVYGWSFGRGDIPPYAVIVALMALEQYFYIKIEQKEEIENEVKTVLLRVKSTAFLNVLCNVGKRIPNLFKTSLKSLLSVPEIYYWDRTINIEGRSHLMIDADWKGENFFNLARQFNQLEHRKKDLQELACELFLVDSTIREFFENVRQQWELRLSKNSDYELYDFIRQLILTFNIQNYGILQHSECGEVIVNVEQQKLQEERAKEIQDLEFKIHIFSLPFSCRKRLDDKKPLNSDEIEIFWQQIQQISSITDENYDAKNEGDPNSCFASPSSVASCIAGGIAVLIHFHRSWLSDNPDCEEWCFKYLKNIILNPPEPDSFDTPKATGNFHWDDFVAEALPLIWAEDKNNEEIRCFIALMIFTRHYSAVSILFTRCYELKSVFLEDFTKLRRFLFEWAFIRNRIQNINSLQNNMEQRRIHEKQSNIRVNQFFKRAFHIIVSALNIGKEGLTKKFFDNVVKWKKKRLKAFIEGDMPSKIQSWKSMDYPKLFCEIDKVLPSWTKLYYLDFQLIQAGHNWLPDLDKISDPKERQDIILFWSEALNYVIQRVSVPRQENQWHGNNYYPRDYEQSILKKIAVTIQYMQPDEHPERLWQTIINLPQDAHHWSKVFLEEFHRYGLQQSNIPLAYCSIIRDIFNYVFSIDSNNIRWSYHDEVWETLLGLDPFSIHYWNERHKILVQKMVDLIEYWVLNVPIYDRRIALFAQWLQTSATEAIRLQGIIWIKEITEKEQHQIFKEVSVQNAIASLLDFIWQNNQNELRQNTPSFKGFKYLLHLLTEQQNIIALELTKIISA
ncbi:AAA family ATPase [Cyanobacterium aponinum FACHB-4101]|uniref:AAA family ATPase n=1 Tax=Cyanobacterium aponinum TaxID=379064 RepID=UPI001681BD35|nr:AAA family ATPase [Cyanobacterium aponinum]MBD2395468.1 AAA family ATPase [Cyanobacterium aponinum FACHB-4101]